MQRDFDLNSVDVCTDSAHVYTDSLKEVFRKTMLNQEIIFQKQVHELHRIYGMQKTLMQNINWMEFDQYDLNKLGLAHSKSQEFLEERRGLFYKFQQRPRGHERTSTSYTSHVDPDNLKLSLSIGDDNRRKQRGKRTWLDEKFSQNVIDLEESTETISNEDSGYAPHFNCAAAAVNSGSKHASLQKSVLTNDPIIPSTPEKDGSRGTLKKSSFLDDRERNSSDQDLKKCDVNDSNINLSPKKQQISSFGRWNVDLNKVYCDDSSCYSDDPMVVQPSTASSSQAFHGLVGRAEETTWTKESNICSDETSGIVHPLVNSNSNYESKEICGAKRPKFRELSGSEVVLALEAVSRQPKAGPSEEVGRNKNRPDDRNVRYALESSKSQIHTLSATSDVNHEQGKSEKDVISHSDHCKNAVQVGQGDIISALCKPCLIGDNESSNAETRQHSEEDSGNPSAIDPFSGNRRGSQAHETLSGEQNLRYSDSSEVNVEHRRENESDKVDDLVLKAAESLINISSACFQDCSVKDGGSTEMENKERETPQYSVDSFELLTLKLKECSEDDLCVSSKAPEVDFAENKDYGFKIRRGRRLKDFQRDILPGLASLSRHEIREDINILEGVLRSREYRKMRAKMADGNNWCLPARSRRSRLNYVARRRFS